MIEVRYGTGWTDTSRPAKTGELDGVDYHFVSREQMERDIDDGLFIEYGEYKGNLYGTSARSVKEIIELGYTCLLNPHHQVSSAALELFAFTLGS